MAPKSARAEAVRYFAGGDEDGAKWLLMSNATAALSERADEALARLSNAVVYGRELGTPIVGIHELASEAQMRIVTWEKAMLGRAPTLRFAYACALWKARAESLIRIARSLSEPPARNSTWSVIFAEAFERYVAAVRFRSRLIQAVVERMAG